MTQPKLFLDMDNVLVDTLSVLNQIDMSKESVVKPDQIPGIFRDLPPIPGAIEAVNRLANEYEIYILSTTAPWHNQVRGKINSFGYNTILVRVKIVLCTNAL